MWRWGTPQEIFRDDTIAQLYDLTQGRYLTGSGSVELKKPDGEPRVFVVGGNGHGLAHYRALQKKRVPFAAGILFENDREYDTACALAREVISVKAFEEMDEAAYERARQCMMRCGTVLDAGAERGTLNRANGALLDFAGEKGLRIVRNADELD